MNELSLEQPTEHPLAAVAEYYASCLLEHAKAQTFVEGKLGMTLDQAIEQKVGFVDRSLNKQLPSRHTSAGQQVRKQLKVLGVLKHNGQETLLGYVTLPVLNNSGEIIGLRGYKMSQRTSGPDEIVIGEASSQSETDDETLKPAHQISASENDITVEAEQVIFTCADRRYRIRGLERNKSRCQLKVNILVSRGDAVHLDTLDLVKARARTSFIKAAATELYVDADTIKKDVGRLLLALENLQNEQLNSTKRSASVVPEMTDSERKEAMTLLHDPKLLQRITADIEACGMVGEATNTLVGYLAATSRHLDQPLAIIIQSSSSAGKTSLMDAVLAMMPAESQLRFSGMTGQSLYYLENDAIRHKTLAISEDEGIAEATYALKLLQSEGELRHATVGKSSDGKSTTQEYHVQGPAQIFLTTTAMEIDEELFNRCLVLTINETRHQTDAIQQIQREGKTFEAFQRKAVAEKLRQLHQNAQRLLKPLRVFNPYAPQLTFANDKTRLRRDHHKYLTLIDAVAFLHQYQRPVETMTIHDQEIEYINVIPSDIAIANRLASEVLGRSLDELSPQTRNFLLQIHDLAQHSDAKTHGHRKEFRFTRREIREAIGWSDFQVRTHLKKLVDLEYVITHRGKNGQRYEYELLYDGQGREGQPFLMGLIDPAKLKEPARSHQTLSPQKSTLSMKTPTLSPA